MEKLRNCPDCNASPGEVHGDNCDVERCTVCGGQYLYCDCGGVGHDKVFVRWTGIWPGKAESTYLGCDLNEFYGSGAYKSFFIKPVAE